MSNIGIYILTYPGDYHLSTALIRSLNYFNPEVPIMVIPGEGVDRDDHPFSVPLMPHPSGFWGRIGHADRKFWAFQGPFEKFIYIDADVICTRSIDPFIEKLKEQEGKFINAKLTMNDEDWNAAISNPEHKWHQQCTRRINRQVGNLELLREFDPNFDPQARYPFNSGMFASTHTTIEEEAFKELHEREVEFFEKRLKQPFSWKSHDLFFGDQGRLNYLVDRLGVVRHTLYPDGHYVWGGLAIDLKLDQVLAGKANYNYIHWAGCPRPNTSLFCKRPLLPLLASAYSSLPPEYSSLKEIPGYSVWRHFNEENADKSGINPGKMAATWRDAKLVFRKNIKNLKQSIRRKFVQT